jgi:hypothetical protein
MIRKVTIMKSSHTKTAPVPAGSAEVAGVEFKDQAPEAQDVFLVGSFNDWNVGIQRAPRGACAARARARVACGRPSRISFFFADGFSNDDSRARLHFDFVRLVQLRRESVNG